MSVWNVLRPPPVDERIAAWTIEHPPGLQSLRAALHRAVADRADLTAIDAADLSERLVIVATELAGNALRHSHPPAVVTLLRAGGHLVLDVVDHDPRTAPTVGHRPPGAGGLGLRLTQRLADDVGWYPTETGKHVWATFSMLPG